MKNTAIVNKLGKSFHKVAFQLKKHSPEILVIAGAAGTVVSAVMACRATTKVSAILEKTKKDIDTIHECVENPEMAEEYTLQDSKKDLAIVYGQTGLQLAKLYAPSVILGALSLTSILTSHNILRKRNIAIAAAYATVNQGFKDYRGNVVERFGEVVDRELKNNIKAKQIEETVVDEKTSKEKKVKKTIEVAEVKPGSGYSFFFDEASTQWQKNAEYNLLFVRAQQQYANDLLRAKGHIFLNEVLEMLGMDLVKEGQVIGWIYDESDDPISANYVDFGIFETHRAELHDHTQAYERTILLNFNPDGNIYNLMDTMKYGNNFKA